ncbi:MAG: hypothetical protein J0L84_00100, partial [Verrucomicrobia bacterium]|nr:hypothetical protein [Verrucomicrobiota bacterium]
MKFPLPLMVALLCPFVPPGAATAAAAPPCIPCDPSKAVWISARRAAGPITVDGHLDESAWRTAENSARLVDLVSGR